MKPEMVVKRTYDIAKDDFISAGEASSDVKKILKRLGVSADAIRRTAISMYEAEMNAVIHGAGGKGHVEIHNSYIEINIIDDGKGISDIDLAMQEGYTTAPNEVRAMGFGAGMGLPNIKRNSDHMKIESTVGKGTSITIIVNFKGA